MARTHAPTRIAGDGNLGRGILNFMKLQSIRKGYLSGRVGSLKSSSADKRLECSEAKDKVFALNALMSKQDSKAIGEYSASVHTVYTRFAALQFTYGMYILDSAGLQRRKLQAKLPSWVPDWTDQSINTGPKIISSLRHVAYYASGGTIPRVRYFDSLKTPTSVGLGGFLFDKLQNVFDLVKRPDTDDVKDFLDRHESSEAHSRTLRNWLQRFILIQSLPWSRHC